MPQLSTLTLILIGVFVFSLYLLLKVTSKEKD